MDLATIVKGLSLEVKCCEESLERKVSWCYSSDLLSDVMANAPRDSIWITLQTHPNTIAVASLAGLAAILISCGAVPDEETLAKAKQEGIPILTTQLPSFEAAGKLYMMLFK